VVVVVVLAIVASMWFIFGNAVQGVQNAFNENLASDRFATENNWNVFNLANNFVINMWQYFLVFVVLGLAYYGYNEAQRRR
jgi:flagellar biosynthesis protein FlhB